MGMRPEMSWASRSIESEPVIKRAPLRLISVSKRIPSSSIPDNRTKSTMSCLSFEMEVAVFQDFSSC